MNALSACDEVQDRQPAGAPGNDPGRCTLIIMVESGVVTGILPTGTVDAVVVDLDMIENEDTFEQRMRKSVLPMAPDGRISYDAMPSLITSIVREYRRPGRRCAVSSPGGTAAA